MSRLGGLQALGGLHGALEESQRQVVLLRLGDLRSDQRLAGEQPSPLPYVREGQAACRALQAECQAGYRNHLRST